MYNKMISNLAIELPSSILRVIGFLPFCDQSNKNEWKIFAANFYVNLFTVMRFSFLIIFLLTIIHQNFTLDFDHSSFVSTLLIFLGHGWILSLVVYYVYQKFYPLSKIEQQFAKYKKYFPITGRRSMEAEIWTLVNFCVCIGYWIAQCVVILRGNANEEASLGEYIMDVNDITCGLSLYNYNCIVYYHIKSLSIDLQLFIDYFQKLRFDFLKEKSILSNENVNQWIKLRKKILVLKKISTKIFGGHRIPFSAFFIGDILFILSAVTRYVMDSQFKILRLLMIIEPVYKVSFSMHTSDLLQVKVMQSNSLIKSHIFFYEAIFF